jgi:hypothetical protein
VNWSHFQRGSPVFPLFNLYRVEWKIGNLQRAQKMLRIQFRVAK